MKTAVSIIGAGSWGTTLAVILSKKGIDVTLHSVFREHNISMQRRRQNVSFLKGVKFPSRLKVNLSLSDTLKNRIIVLAVPVKFIRGVLGDIRQAGVLLKGKVFVSVSKGIEVKSLKRVSQIIAEELGTGQIAVLSGPNIAKEALEGIPTTTVVACKNKNTVQFLQKLFSTPGFRAYCRKDIVGVELGGALKNIIALACGISDGLGFGANTKAALITRGLVEIMRLGQSLGAQPSTFWGVSGLGDLVTTCFSPYSRNRCLGEEIGKGKKLADILRHTKTVAEGVETTKAAFNLSRKLGVDMPITSEVYYVLYKNKPPKKGVGNLMQRPLKAERME